MGSGSSPPSSSHCRPRCQLPFQLNATHRNATQYTDFKLQPLIGKLPSSLVAAVTPNLLIVANLNAAAVVATVVASLGVVIVFQRNLNVA